MGIVLPPGILSGERRIPLAQHIILQFIACCSAFSNERGKVPTKKIISKCFLKLISVLLGNASQA